jgi:hypothetical protein
LAPGVPSSGTATQNLSVLGISHTPPSTLPWRKEINVPAMRLSDTSVERFGAFTLHPVHVARIRLTRCTSIGTSTGENREAETSRKGLSHGPRFNAIARKRNFRLDGSYVRGNDSIQRISGAES